MNLARTQPCAFMCCPRGTNGFSSVSVTPRWIATISAICRASSAEDHLRSETGRVDGLPGEFIKRSCSSRCARRHASIILANMPAL